MIRECILEFYDKGMVKFGSFQLKSGIISPVYMDLRLIVSFPSLLEKIASLLWEKVQHLSFDFVCGVPYTALPLATAISLSHQIPMVMRRKEKKEYGTKKTIEGVYQPGQTCLIIEDLVTSGLSVFETIAPLEEEGLKVSDVVVILDRQQGAKKNIESKGYHLHALITIKEMLAILVEAGKIDRKIADEVEAFIDGASQ